ncbi:MAG: GAF domain-containing protein, partial [Gemmatimonadetes bacterium]|nr:GAF domain-containing protein [Gemmatimonadota bacterium]
LLADGRAPDCPHRDASTYAATLGSREVRVFRDLGSCGHRTRYEAGLLERGIRSLALLPLFVDDRMVGLLELGSPQAGAVDAYRALQLKSVLPAFAIALQRALDEREDRLQAIIKRRYTAIHPAVEWRFRSAALKLLDAGSEEDPELDAIVFPDVYPLYGLTDIRNSSDARQVCARTDLTTQIRLARAVVDGAGRDRPLPVLRELAHRLDRLEERVGEGTLVEDEDEVVRFLGAEVEPLMDRLSAANGALASSVAAYREALDPQLGIVYGARREFEASVARFNEAICAVIDREQLSAQEAFPHYFERFKTDGVDYNVYVGDSLSPDGGFTRLYLQNLRLWQLQLACRIEWELQRLRPQLPMDLPATHLILAQDQPLTIRFRVDEKRFDVDGAYNTHELVKKRIDKVRTRSGERLTQPGTVAIVYSHAHEGQLYRRHLEYLTADGFFQGDVEQLALEDVQGVPGLKGMRVAIAPEPAGVRVQDALTPDTPDRGA